MRIEPELNLARLEESLRDRYQIEVASLTFVPLGLDSWSYVATCLDGSRVFVKLARGSSERRPSEVPLMAALAARGVPVPRPIGDRTGGYVNDVEGYEVQVLEYLQGRSLEDETAWPDELYARVADTVAAVHRSTGAVRHLVARVEAYELPFLPHFAETLAAIEAGGVLPDQDEVALARLRDLVGPKAPALRAGIDRLQALRDLAQARPSHDVLCHTDIWGSNLLLGDDGTLHLLDWNGALIGPPEQDLFMFAGTSFFPAHRFGWFLDRYEAAFSARPEADTLGFYLYRRNLEDLAGFVGDMAEGRMEAMSPTAMLRLIQNLLAETPLLDGQIERVRDALARRESANL